jgi:hypothetical protein
MPMSIVGELYARQQNAYSLDLLLIRLSCRLKHDTYLTK